MDFLIVKYNKHDITLSYRSYHKIVKSFSDNDKEMLLLTEDYQVVLSESKPTLFTRYLAISRGDEPAGYLDLDEVDSGLLNISFGVATPFRNRGISNKLLSRFIKETPKLKRKGFSRVNWFCKCENRISNYLATKYKFSTIDDWVEDLEFNGYYLIL